MALTKLTAIQIGNAVRVEDVMYGEDSTMPPTPIETVKPAIPDDMC